MFSAPPLPPPLLSVKKVMIPADALTEAQVGDPAELRNLIAALGPRDDAIRRGMTLQGQRYEVRRALCKQSMEVLIDCCMRAASGSHH